MAGDAGRFTGKRLRCQSQTWQRSCTSHSGRCLSKLKQSHNVAFVPVFPAGLNEKCEVPTDPAYPACAEKVEVRGCKTFTLQSFVVKVFFIILKFGQS